MNTVFSHRPEAGISIAISCENGQAFLSASFRNATEPNFSRRLARQVLEQRIRSFTSDLPQATTRVRFVTNRTTDLTAPRIMHHLRQLFKPEHEESDPVFAVEFMGEAGVDERRSMSRDQSWDLIVSLFDEAIRLADRELAEAEIE